MRVCLILVVVVAVVVGCGGVVWAAEIGAVQASAAQVPRYGKLELSPLITGQWSNPFDPDQVDVSAEFTAPSGKTLTVPGFWYQEHAVATLAPEQARQHMTMLKLYIEERSVAWKAHSSVEFFLDDVELHEAATGKRVPLDDMEKPETRWYIPKWVAPSEEIVHGGKRSLRFRTDIGAEEEWPGAILPLNGADWSAYDGISLWVYPRVDEPLGMINLYFADAVGGNSPIKGWQVGSEGLKPNQWNHLTWDWRDFPTRNSWEPKGTAGWRVRFCPTETGRWTYRVRVRDGAGTAMSQTGSFGCVASTSPGFVRISRDDPHYFDFDNGKAFVPIGHDVAWGVADARALFPKMHAAGENCTYFIMMPDDTDLEWGKLGEYDLLAAAKMDSLVEAAEKSDIYFKLSFDVHDSLRAGATWERNPYSAKRGGPCASPNDFYTNPAAQKLYQRRLRYIAARWGYSTHMIAWEPVAEIDGGVERDGQAGWGYPGKPGAEAVTAMLTSFLKSTSAYLRQVCPYGRLFTNSFGGDVSDPDIWALPEVQYTQLHHYDSVDVGRTMSEWCGKLTGDYAKPLMVTEFGWWADWNKPFLDREGVCQHNGIWASMLGGAAGSAQSWWWEHIDEWNLYPHYLALRRFVEGVDFPREGFRLARAKTQTPPGGPCGPVRFPGSGAFVGARVADFTVLPDGSVTDAPEVPGYLLAAGRSEARINPTFHLTCPQSGTFSLHVEVVSPDAELTILVDGQTALKRDLPAENVPGKSCTFSERWKLWECKYDEDFSVPLTAGRHDVRLENTKPGFSWIRVTSYAMSNYAPPALRVVGLQGRHLTLLWLQNTQHTWVNAIAGFKPAALRGATVTLQGVTDGLRTVEWWDTYQGRLLHSEKLSAAGGRLVLTVPPLDRDIACKVKE